MRYDYTDHVPDSDEVAHVKEIEAIESAGIRHYLCPKCGTNAHTRWYRNNWCFCFLCDKFFTLEDMNEYLIFLDEQDKEGAYAPGYEGLSDMDKIAEDMEVLLND